MNIQWLTIDGIHRLRTSTSDGWVEYGRDERGGELVRVWAFVSLCGTWSGVASIEGEPLHAAVGFRCVDDALQAMKTFLVGWPENTLTPPSGCDSNQS